MKVASALTRLGYGKGDVLAVYSTNCPEFTFGMLGAAAAGIIVTTMNPAYTSGKYLTDRSLTIYKESITFKRNFLK